MNGNTSNAAGRNANKNAARKNVERALAQADFMSVEAGVSDVEVWNAETEETETETHKGFFVTHDHTTDPNTDESGTTEYFVSAETVHGKVVPFRCSCPHHKYRDARCKHMKVVDMDVDANPFL